MGEPSQNPELWAFLESLHCGEILSGTVTAIERFGVFVALDDGPLREPTGTSVDARPDVVQVGEEVTVVVVVDRERRRLVLSRRQVSSDRR
ncbi:S1 RNA-binding domain-containing protein [Streptomyces scopuliridis]|uniref:S1 RNA-binding domain-containing protein n=1 Tax=Streptomyces scopuliridis TaxID=452529 RepID=UPI0036CF2BDE